MTENALRPNNLDHATIDAPEDVGYEDMLEAACLA